MHTRAAPFGIKVVVADEETFQLDSAQDLFGALIQYPYSDGNFSPCLQVYIYLPFRAYC